MNGYNLIRKLHMKCPLCDKDHEIEERTRTVTTIIKGEKVSCQETYFFCQNCDEDENEFVTGKMENDNLLNARNAYRKAHGLLTSSEIVKIREKYGLSQVDLAKLLGWGEATISRYESKAIQDDAYDNVLRIINDNPLTAISFLSKHANKFSDSKRNEIRENIMATLNSDVKETLQRTALESEYANYQDCCDANGFKLLDIDKLEAIISYFAMRIKDLYKVKLMKLLWYADTISYKQTGKAMTGLVYIHETMGALPIGHYKIGCLEKINMQEEEIEGYENTRFHFLPNNDVDMNCLTDQDKTILDLVINKFEMFSSQRIVEYMHKELAYINTKDKEIIPFSLAKDLRDF